ncbi:hypothetical protein FHG64_12790 [Antarcticibacterium flavum]|uniref:Uncharacterized protein n=1 Tax=Antarcticibacterium flavum TaxID=2058175 RepID=A0A5B7X680_9FLAO|nr:MULTISPECIES: hypothetical protein [Antarcticibacterium]MCM4158455.1 hypothetical protein [Antarcticibacterium sp. W02-3]QCY70211.1 hypothetical protein FHG64_12790 [Antarcticibacterium flavum]
MILNFIKRRGRKRSSLKKLKGKETERRQIYTLRPEKIVCFWKGRRTSKNTTIDNDQREKDPDAVIEKGIREVVIAYLVYYQVYNSKIQNTAKKITVAVLAE